METYNDQLFPPAFLVNYTKEPAGRQRCSHLLRFFSLFLSCVSEEHPDLAQFLADQVSCPSAEDSFEILEDYLSADDYFSPSIAADGFEPFYLYAAIVLTAGVPFGTTTPVIDSLIEDHAPEAASLPYADGNLPLDALLVDCRNFYAAHLPVPDASHGRTGCFAAAVFKCIPSGISLQLRVFCSL